MTIKILKLNVRLISQTLNPKYNSPKISLKDNNIIMEIPISFPRNFRILVAGVYLE